MHLVGFTRIISVYHDALSSECQIQNTLNKYCCIRVYLTDDIHVVQTYRFVFNSQEYKFLFVNVSYMLRDYLWIP